MTVPTRLPFLLEIGSEEIPARFIPTAMEAIAAQLEALLAELHLGHQPLRVLATPRRLAVISAGLDTGQPDRVEEVKGPPVSAAYDAEGNPTRAGLGFAAKLGIDLAACGRAEDQRGAYLVARRTIPGRPAIEVLAERLGALVLGLPFRKTMRWGTLDIEYARPLQWLLCLLGGEVVPFSVGDVTSGRTTRGHRTLAGDEARPVATVDAYEGTLAALAVVPDPAERRARILAQAESCLAALPQPGALRDDEDLLTEVVHLCEHPTVFVGQFVPSFFELPPEVIVTALKAHQRYFVVDRRDGGGLLPCFVAVRDGGGDHLDTVRAGNERVLRARLDDALFYWRFDQKRTPDEHAAALRQVTWLEGLGSVADHTRRAAVLVERLWREGAGDGGAAPPVLLRAAAINRFDLVTEMIKDGKEFTKLEGQIAARYAAAAGEDPAVCAILTGCQLPRSSAGALPADASSAALSLAWRLDTLAGCWLAGFAPTGAKDPYALRRHALAVLRILLDRGWRVDLGRLLGAAVDGYADLMPEASRRAAADELLAFVLVRLEGWLADTNGTEPALLKAILPVHGQDPADAVRWLDALAGFRNHENFLLLARGFKRCANILEGAVLPVGQRADAVSRWLEGGRGAAGEDFGTLAEPAERALRDAVVAAVPSLRELEAKGDYVQVFQLLAEFGPTIDHFFDTVRVNAEEAALKALRHAFLREVDALFRRYADFGQVAPEEERLSK